MANLRVRTRKLGDPAIDEQWLHDNIKTKVDVERQPTSNGMTARYGVFVTSMRKYIMEVFRYNVITLHGTVNDIFETHNSLYIWGHLDPDQGGGHAMPREFQAIRDWIAEKEGDHTTVLSCVASIGWVK